MKTLSILLTKLSYSILKLIGRGGSLPGTIGLKMDKNILSKLQFNGPIILVTGTNGKTSTANMITDLFSHAGYNVISNRKGDNMRPGIVTTILSNTCLNGQCKANAVVLEVDELNIKYVLPQLPVSALVVTNFFRDQLDRAKEMEQLIQSIESVLDTYEGKLILNGNDPNVVRLALKAKKAERLYFGMDKNIYSSDISKEANEGKFCPKCGNHLVYDYYQYSHIGKFKCSNCDFATPELFVLLKNINLDQNSFVLDNQSFKCPYDGLYSMYNCAVVLAVAKTYYIDYTYVNQVFEHAPKPKGRNESFEKNGTKCTLNLVKNPTGANEVMKVIERDHSEKNICIVLNDKEQDGTDVSWIYDTLFEKIMDTHTNTIICTGSRGYDMALRIYYSDFKGNLEVVEDLDSAVSLTLKKGSNIYVIATYTALLPARNAIIKEL